MRAGVLTYEFLLRASLDLVYDLSRIGSRLLSLLSLLRLSISLVHDWRKGFVQKHSFRV